MKGKKLIIGLFLVSLICGAYTVLADTPYDVMANVKIPALKNEYTSDPHNKTEEGHQYVKTTNVSHDVVLATRDSNGNQSEWIDGIIGIVSWSGPQQNGNTQTGAYNLKIKHKSNILSGKYSGTWVLNPSYVGAI